MSLPVLLQRLLVILNLAHRENVYPLLLLGLIGVLQESLVTLMGGVHLVLVSASIRYCVQLRSPIGPP